MIRRLGFVILLLGHMCACTGRYRPPNDTLVVALSASPTTLDPRFATDANGQRIGGLIFQSLVRPGDGFQVVGDAAEKWTCQRRHCVFDLAKNLQFHNGRKVEPEDINYSFAFYRSEKSPFASQLTEIQSVKATSEDDHIRVHLNLKRAIPHFLLSQLPAVKILPKAEVEQLGSDFSQHLIGTGPFQFDQEVLNEIRLQSFNARISKLIFKIIRDDYTRYQKLLKGEVDFAQAELPPERIVDFENRPNEFNVWKYPGLSMSYVLINFRDPILKQYAARLALAQTLERQEIIQFKMAGLANVATSLLTPNNPYFHRDLSNPPLAVDAAKSAIARLNLAGRSLKLKTANSPQAIANGKVLANQMSRSGLNIELESYEWSTFYADVRKGQFQLATMRWVGTIDPDIYNQAFHSRELPPGRNRGAYANAEVDLWLQKGALSESREERHQIFLQVQKRIHDDLAILPLWYDEQVAVARKNVLNFKPSLTSDFRPLAQVTKQEATP